MPIEIQADFCRPSEDQFAALAYELMDCVFQVHNEIGRFFDEKKYKRLVAKRFGDVRLEAPVVVHHGEFRKTYFLDMVVRKMALFEWKAVDSLTPSHRGQLLNYLLLCDLPKGKLINVRPEAVEHEFVNTTLRTNDRRRFTIDQNEFQPLNGDDNTWPQFLVDAIRDWGTGLDFHLYEGAIAHCFGGSEQSTFPIDIKVDAHKIGKQKARLTPSGAAFKVTTFSDNTETFEHHARRFLAHTTLPAIHWINVSRKTVRFKTLINLEV